MAVSTGVVMLTYFNSIKVRLKLAQTDSDAPAEGHFNSIKVRLKQEGHVDITINDKISIP